MSTDNVEEVGKLDFFLYIYWCSKKLDFMNKGNLYI